MQGPEPVVVLYVFTGHVMHGPPFGPVNPVRQKQSVIAVLAWNAHVSVGQVVHAAVPVVSLYFPESHFVHVPLPWYPMLQRQLVCPERAFPEFGLQATQLAVLVDDLYVPGAQFVHVVVILVTLHVILKPSLTVEPSEVNLTLKMPVGDV
jgi:hypothetical protein